MQINTREGIVGQPGDRPSVVIATHLIREKEMLDKEGNVINPRTKEIIRRKDAKTDNQ